MQFKQILLLAIMAVGAAAPIASQAASFSICQDCGGCCTNDNCNCKDKDGDCRCNPCDCR